jgi:drug/metabolite transporter (DMT)-like permease
MHNLSNAGLLNLLVVYIVWSSTYLAIRVAVAEGSGFPPFSMGASRMLITGIIFLLIAWLRKQRISITGRELIVIAVSGFFLWTGGNGLLIWSEQHVHSGLAALLVSTTPLWVALIEAILARRMLSPLLIMSLFFGLGGIAVLIYPSLSAGNSSDFFSGMILLGASISWAIGSVIQKRNQLNISDFTLAGYQTLIASLTFFILSFLFSEPVAQPTQNAWLAWGYLIIFGSVIAYSSYVSALRLLPINIMMTYAFVNPVLAVFLGWFILGETITLWTIAGATLVVLSVVGVFWEHAGIGMKGSEDEKTDVLHC